MDSAQLLALVSSLKGRAVAVVGDVVADEFVYGRVARVSREAPVLILEYDSTEVVAGGAGNAASNVAALGGRAWLVAVVGRDEPGRRLVGSLHRGRRNTRQDTHPCRWCPFRETTGCAHRSQRWPVTRRRDSPALRACRARREPEG